jgi:hypothetical protein
MFSPPFFPAWKEINWFSGEFGGKEVKPGLTQPVSVLTVMVMGVFFFISMALLMLRER